MRFNGLQTTEVWYRYVDMRWVPSLNEFDEPQGSGTSDIQLQEYEVLKHTPKGVWLDDFPNKRFVRASTRKQFAHPDRAAAMTSFLARKTRQLKIYTARIKHIQEVMVIAVCMIEKKKVPAPNLVD